MDAYCGGMDEKMLIVQKFGGSSLADIERLRTAAGICLRARRRGHEVVVVVSAMGSSTDALIDLAQKISAAPSKRELDALMATGEQQSAALMAMTLESMGMRACSFTGWQTGIYTDRIHGEAEIEFVSAERLYGALIAGQIPVVAGFQGISSGEDITTLGRGGSDTSAAALCAAIDADCCEIYTDVDGIYTADPRLVSEAVFIKEIDCRDMLLLARAGSQVLHSKSVELAMANGVELRLLPAYKEGEGSLVRILSDRERPPIAGVTRNAAESEVTLVGKSVSGETMQAMVEALEHSGIKVAVGCAGSGFATVKVEPDRLIDALGRTHAFMLELLQ